MFECRRIGDEVPPRLLAQSGGVTDWIGVDVSESSVPPVSIFQVGDAVRWTSDVGVPFAGVVRYIPEWAPHILHITCDPKRCSAPDLGVWHVAADNRVDYDNPTLF